MEEKETVVKEEVKEKKNDISRSKQKRIDREKQAKALKKSNVLSKVIWIVIAVAFVGAIAALIGTNMYKESQKIVANGDFGAQLEDNGFIKGVKATDYITLCDYKNIVVPASEVEYTDAEFEEDVKNVLESHKELNTEDGIIKDGDTVNIDYVGTIDGVEFEGGNSNEQGSDLTIGSGQFVDDFEQQLIGFKPGDMTTVAVTFPEDYQSADVAGKDAEFVVTINGIYEVPEMTDEFVADKLAAYGSTVEEYHQYLKDTNYEDRYTAYIEKYLTDNSTIAKYPKKYLKSLKETTRFQDEQSFQYMNQMYMQYYGSGYGSFEEYTGQTEEEYLADLTTRAEETCKIKLADQAILESEGITVTEADAKAYIAQQYGSEDSYASVVEEMGAGAVANEAIHGKVLEIIKGYAKVQ